MTSMAAALAASLPVPLPSSSPKPPSLQPNGHSSTKVPQRMEGVVDPEGLRDVESVSLDSLVFLKIMKHSTDILPPTSQSTLQTDRNAPPPTALSSHPDALGVLLGLDMDGVMEVEDCFALPSGESSLGANSYSTRFLAQIREVQTPDSPIGVYLSTHNGGYATRVVIDLLSAVEKVSGRGRAILVVHDASRAPGRDLSIKAYRLSEGAKEVVKGGKWDAPTLADNKVTAATLLSPLPVNLTSPALLDALLATFTSAPTPPKPSLSSPSVPLPPNFAALTNPLPTSLPRYLSDTLDALTLHSHEANNVAFLVRQIGREKSRHEQAIKDREDDNIRRGKQGLGELPSVGEMKGGTQDPNRLELLCLQGQVDGLTKNMGAEAGKGLVRCYL